MRAMMILATLMAIAGPAAAAETWRGAAHAKDGDSWFFVIPSPTRPGRTVHREIRASGIDAPELTQPCERDGAVWFAGWEGGRWLAGFLHGKTVTCTATGEKTYGRAVANCTVGGADLQEIIVRAGWAVDNPRYSGGKYSAAEGAAKAAGRGIHAGHCEAPWLWRRKHY